MRSLNSLFVVQETHACVISRSFSASAAEGADVNPVGSCARIVVTPSSSGRELMAEAIPARQEHAQPSRSAVTSYRCRSSSLSHAGRPEPGCRSPRFPVIRDCFPWLTPHSTCKKSQVEEEEPREILT